MDAEFEQVIANYPNSFADGRQVKSASISIKDSDGQYIAALCMKLVVEPTGCLGFAAARQMKAKLQGKLIGVIISGGNVDMARFASLLTL